MKTDEQIAAEVESVYRWIESEIAQTQAHSTPCRQCGQCCDFEAYDHRLYVTSAELVHFLTRTGHKVPESTGSTCPYNIDGLCTVHQWRFAGCRIFICSGNPQVQARISEEAIRRFRQICERFSLEYRYVNLLQAGQM